MVSWDESRNLTPHSLSENGEQLSQSDSSQSVTNSVGTSTLKRFSREHDIFKWSLLKHNKRTPSFYVVVLVVVKSKRWSCSSKHHEVSGKWWSCGKHDDPPYKLDSMYQVVRLMVLLQRWRTRNAMQKNNCLVMLPSVVSKKRKRVDLSSCFEEIREHYGKTREKATNYIGVRTGKLRCIWRWWSYTKSPKLIEAPVVISTSVEAPTSVVAASIEPVVATNITHDRATPVFHQQEQTILPDELARFKKTKREQFIENATASAVKQLTIKATYEENIVKFSFTLLDGLEKLKEMVATRFQLKLGSFKLKYVDEDDDMILMLVTMI